MDPWVIAIFLLVALAIAGVVISSNRTQLLHRAAEYAGYGEQYEGTDFEIGRKPSYDELLEGIGKQPEEFLRRLRHLLTRLSGIEERAQVALVQKTERALEIYLRACEGGYRRNAHALPVHAVCAEVRALADRTCCSEEVRTLVRGWSGDVITWRVVAGRLVQYLQRKIKESATQNRA